MYDFTLFLYNNRVHIGASQTEKCEDYSWRKDDKGNHDFSNGGQLQKHVSGVYNYKGIQAYSS